MLNRDEIGLSKRLPYGGVSRTRVSSQCLKRYWSTAEDPHSLDRISALSVRSRDLVSRIIRHAQSGGVAWDQAVAEALAPWFKFAIYGSRAEDAPTKLGQASRFEDKRQPLLFGLPEIRWLGEEFARMMARSKGDPDRAFALARKWVAGEGAVGNRKAFLANMSALRKRTRLPAGLTAALFGRLVTSDPAANITGALHVAHAFSVHAEEAEIDYLAAVDDLVGTGLRAATLQEEQLTSNLMYTYAVVDIPLLAANLGEALPSAELTRQVLHNLVHLIAEVSPGTKRGSTAPYSRASLLLLEAGARQPRSLAGAFRNPCAPEFGAAAESLAVHLRRMDEIYATGEQRRYLSIAEVPIAQAQRGSLADLAEWARSLPHRFSA